MIPSWLHNVHASFQRAMDVNPLPVKWNSGQVYLDNIVIFSKTVKDYRAQLQQALTSLRDSGRNT